MALQYVFEKFKTDKICDLALDNYAGSIQYFPSNKITYGLYEKIVKKNGFDILYVDVDLLYVREYHKLCEIAIMENPLSLMNIKNYLPVKLYLLAVQSNGLALEYVPKNCLCTEEYLKICETAVKNDGLALAYVPDKFKTDEICDFAVKQNGFASQFIKKNDDVIKVGSLDGSNTKNLFNNGDNNI